MQNKCTKMSVSIEKNGKVRSQHINYDISRFKECKKWSSSEKNMTIGYPIPNGTPENTHTNTLL